jgi:hypothetical protein
MLIRDRITRIRSKYLAEAVTKKKNRANCKMSRRVIISGWENKRLIALATMVHPPLPSVLIAFYNTAGPLTNPLPRPVTVKLA